MKMVENNLSPQIISELVSIMRKRKQEKENTRKNLISMKHHQRKSNFFNFSKSKLSLSPKKNTQLKSKNFGDKEESKRYNRD